MRPAGRCSWELAATALLWLAASLPAAAAEAGLEALGRELFFDTALSQDRTVSCASCHEPAAAFSDGRPRSRGVGGAEGTRNAPSLNTAARQDSLFWEGRRKGLEALMPDPLFNPQEMALKGEDELRQRLAERPAYAAGFTRAFGDAATSLERTGQALSAYVRSLDVGDNAFDRFRDGQMDALAADARSGLELFTGKAGCADCHRVEGRRTLLSDQQFHNTGLGLEQVQARLPELIRRVSALDPAAVGDEIARDAAVAALGRFLVTRRAADIGAFRTPSLRNVARTAPYMHDGSIATLEQAVQREIYYRGLSRGEPISLSQDDQRALAAFLRALDD